MNARAPIPSELSDPIALELLQAAIPARLAYNWFDGTPRVVPIWFHWTGDSFVLVGSVDAPKVDPILKRPDVALSIDSNEWPYRVLMVRGIASVDVVQGLPDEYRQAAVRYMGNAGADAWLAVAEQLLSETARITVRPTWACILDFETRFPAALAKRMAS